MNIRRIVSYVLVAALAAILWTTWTREHPKAEPSKQQATETAVSSSSAARKSASENFAPETFNPGEAKQQSTKPKSNVPVQATTAKGKVVLVTTDTLNVGINLNGGTITQAGLPKYPVSLKDKSPMQILSSRSSDLYIAQSGLTNTGAKGKTVPIQYTADKTSYQLQPNSNTLVVSLKGTTANGLQVTKNYIFTKGSYAIKLSYSIKNTASKAWNGSLYNQFVRREPASTRKMFHVSSYNGASISSPSTPYDKITYKKMNESPINQTNPGGWVAMQQHYFLSAFVPVNQKQPNHYYSHVRHSGSGSGIYTLGFVGTQKSIAPGQTGTAAATLYVGPEIAKNLSALAPGLDRTIDFGWLWWVSIIIFWIMSLIHSVVGNWGWAIVITTIIIKLVLYPLSATSFRSMARMRELQPKMQALKERHADDRQAMSKATMELYRKEKINPLGGCLPMLIQVPVFIGLYYVIIESVQLRQAPFILWIHDLAVKDPYYILPILMGASMLLLQRLTPSSPDPMQAKMMMIVPVVFTFFFLNFPAGLTLYWLVNNCMQILQQWYVTKTLDAHKIKKAKKAKGKKKKSKFNLIK